MKHKIEQHKGSDLLKVSLDGGEQFTTRAASVSTYGGDINIDTTTTRSIWKAVGTYENYPVADISSEKNGGVVTISPPLPGEIQAVKPMNDKLLVQSLGFVGSYPTYDLDLKTKKLYDNESIALVSAETKKQNPLFIIGYEGVSTINLSEEQRTTVRQDHILAMDSSIQYTKESSATLKERALGTDYDPYMKLSGPGSVYTHVRSPIDLNKVMQKLSDG